MPRREGEKFPRAGVAVREARRFLSQVLSDWHVENHLDDALLCLSELATNVVCHTDDHDGYFVVEIVLSADRLRVTVHDSADDPPLMRRPNLDDLGGRGLVLVDALADKWGMAPRKPGGKSVWAELEVGSPANPEPEVASC